MKMINRRALAALVFGFLTLGAGVSYARQPTKAHSCCGPECGATQSKRDTATDSRMSRWHKAKHGWDLAGTGRAASSATHDCCKGCC